MNVGTASTDLVVPVLVVVRLVAEMKMVFSDPTKTKLARIVPRAILGENRALGKAAVERITEMNTAKARVAADLVRESAVVVETEQMISDQFERREPQTEVLFSPLLKLRAALSQ